jgi:hypothetical protein
MILMNIKFVPADHEKGIWGDIRPEDILDCGTLTDVAVLEDGMQSGLPSVMFRIKIPGKVAIVQQTARQIVSLGRVIMVKYPKLMED